MARTKPLRKKGWIGTRIEVCGRPFQTKELGDFICVLPPGHDSHRHSSVAIDSEDNIFHLVFDEETNIVSYQEW